MTLPSEPPALPKRILTLQNILNPVKTQLLVYLCRNFQLFPRVLKRANFLTSLRRALRMHEYLDFYGAVCKHDADQAAPNRGRQDRDSWEKQRTREASWKFTGSPKREVNQL